MTTRPSRLEGISRLLAVIVTNATKLGGVYVGIKAAPTANAVVLGFAAFMIAGGQVAEGTFLAVIERFFSAGEPPPKGEP